MSVETKSSSTPTGKSRYKIIFQSSIALGLLAILVYMLFGEPPGLDDDQRLILFFLLSLLPALVIGSEAQSRFDIKLPGYVASTTGATAVFFIAFFLINQTGATETVLIFKVKEHGQDFILNTGSNITKVPKNSTSREKGLFTDGNTLIIVLNKSADVLPVEFFKHGVVRHCAIVSKKSDTLLEIGKNLSQSICDSKEYLAL